MKFENWTDQHSPSLFIYHTHEDFDSADPRGTDVSTKVVPQQHKSAQDNAFPSPRRFL